ncbi:hypothetical protein BJV77DRAFT_966360 [Russula vinacea]|nr:hypothetical protein BJV77DRAFT_966360 [Russula vinacea]
MSSSIPQRHSPQFTPAPLPIPTRRPTHRANRSLSGSDDGTLDTYSSNSSHLMTQYPYQDSDEDPLRHTYCAFERVSSHENLQLAVLNRTSPILPTHILAIHDAPLSDPNAPVTLIPVNIDVFSLKLRTSITNARHNPPRRVSVSSSSPFSPTTVVSSVPLPATVVIPLVPFQVPHAPSVPLLLLYALGVRTNPSALAATLLPLSVAEEFPSAAAMAQAMAMQCQRENAGVVAGSGGNEDNAGGVGGEWRLLDRHVEERARAGLQDSRVMSVVQTVWNVTAESRKILARQRERQNNRE